jgi:hypothetical protein
MATPSRFPSGISNAAPWQFFAAMGQPNPFFYHSFRDDFDLLLANTGWVTTETTGTATQTAGNGGIVTLATAATVATFVSIQRPVATFTPIAGKKTFFVARLNLADVSGSVIVAGLMPITATPFVASANAIWISKTAGSLQFVLNVTNAGVTTSTNIPMTAFTPVNGVNFDIGFEVTTGDVPSTSIPGPQIIASIGPNLVGYLPQSGTGQPGSTNRAPNVNGTPALITTLQATPLAPTVGVLSGTGAIETLNLDFIGAFQER